MGGLSFGEVIFIFVAALVILGPKKLPELGRTIGKGLAEFRRASAELRSSLDREMQNMEQEVKAQETAKAAAPSTHESQPYEHTFGGSSSEHTD